MTYFNINPGHILPPAPEAPADQPGELVVAGVLADQGTASVTLRVRGVMRWMGRFSGTETLNSFSERFRNCSLKLLFQTKIWSTARVVIIMKLSLKTSDNLH